MPFVVWITGLPGSGKSTIAKRLVTLLDASGVKAEYLRLDEFRKEIAPSPKYTDEERDKVYSELSSRATKLNKEQRNVIVDATAHKAKFRADLKALVPDLVEVYVKCSLETCIERESKRKSGLVAAELYRKALERRRTGKTFEGLGDVVGVDVPFEEGSPDLVIESDKAAAEQSAKAIMDMLKRRSFIK